MKTLTVIAMLLIGAVSSVQGQEQKANLTTCPAGWTAGPDSDWKIFWNDALSEARQTGKKIFVLSTGSDWCGWCMKLKKEVLTTEAFKDFAKKNLVLLYLDSPRKPLPEAQTLHNRAVCRELSLSGGVPCAAIFSADARRLGVLSGGGYTASNYVERLEKMLTEKGELPKSGEPSALFTEGYDEDKLTFKTGIVEVDGIGWKYKSYNGCVTLLRCESVASLTNHVSIPRKIAGCPVTVIDAGAFRGAPMTSVDIPDTVTKIEYAAFHDCSNLESITIPRSVLNIGYEAFYGCCKVKTITIESARTELGTGAFSTDGLKELIFPAGSRIGGSSFTYSHGYVCRCTGEGDYPPSIGTSWYELTTNGLTWAFTVESSGEAAVIARPCTYSTRIEHRSTICPSTTGTLVVPSRLGGRKVTRIGFDAFSGCTNLTEIVLPEDVRAIGSCAFSGCRSLRHAPSLSNVTYLGPYAFSGCSGLGGGIIVKDGWVIAYNGDLPTHFVIPDGVTGIAGGVFRLRHELTSVDLPPTVKFIGEGAFWGCGRLKEVNIPESVEYIGNGAFDGCSALGKGVVVRDHWAIAICGECPEHVELPSCVVDIAENLFSHQKNLRSIAIPPGVGRIGRGAFEKCTALSSVKLPEGVTNIGYYAFLMCTNLTTIAIPKSVRMIEENAFDRCVNLRHVDLPACVTEVMHNAFDRTFPTTYQASNVAVKTTWSVASNTCGWANERARESYRQIVEGLISLPQVDWKAARTEVTQGQWESIMGENPSFFKGEKLPVESVGIADCQEFLSRLNMLHEECGGEGRFRLPDAREWLYAAEAGKTDTDGCQSDGKYCSVYAFGWGPLVSGGMTHPTGQKKPNAFGLCDMFGNVAEWCVKCNNGWDRRGDPTPQPVSYLGGSWAFGDSPRRWKNAGGGMLWNDGCSVPLRRNDIGFRVFCFPPSLCPKPLPVASPEAKRAVPRQGGLRGGGSLRARRLQRRQQEQAAEARRLAARRQAEQDERQGQTDEEKSQREAEQEKQRAQLVWIQEELKRVRAAKAAEEKQKGQVKLRGL